MSLISCFWKFKIFRFLFSRYPVILLYHDVPKVEIIKGKYGMNGEIFEKQVSFLSKYFKIVDYRNYNRRRGLFDKVEVILTFDDGFKNNYDVAVPILEKYSANAIFFVSSRHIKSEKTLWFQYLKLFSLFYPDPNGFVISLGLKNINTLEKYREYLISLDDHPNSIYTALAKFPPLETFLTKFQIDDWISGMTMDNLKMIAKNQLFTLGIHTNNHPFLTKCSKDDIFKEIYSNKIFLEEITTKTVDTIAYPIGDYNMCVIDICKSLGIYNGFAVINKNIINSKSTFEIERIGIYTGSITHLGMKVIGSRLFFSNKFEWLKKIFRG